MCDHSDDVDELSASDDSEPEEQPSRVPFDPEVDHDDDDDSQEGVVSATSAQTTFSLRGGSSAFSDRSHNIFACLDTQLSTSMMKQDHLTHGEFVKPQISQSSRKTSQTSAISPPPKKRGAPDYLVHPERWTHYSLEDVTETSDQDNSKAAHQFLSSLQQDKQTDSACNVQQKLVFNRPKRLLNEQTAGQLSAVRGNQREMHLSHLEEEEEEKEVAKGKRMDQSEGKRDKEKSKRAKTETPEDEKRVHKEKDQEERKIDKVNLSFASFRKAKSKNYRKCSEQEDN